MGWTTLNNQSTLEAYIGTLAMEDVIFLLSEYTLFLVLSDLHLMCWVRAFCLYLGIYLFDIDILFVLVLFIFICTFGRHSLFYEEHMFVCGT